MIIRTTRFQCPTTGFLLFYENIINQFLCKEHVSMPYHGLSSFLLKNNFTEKINVKCFNALPRAFFFSTLRKLKFIASICIVSMPYHGLSSFLQLRHKEVGKGLDCFNALPRAFFFSTVVAGSTKREQLKMFQCPTTGFLLFYKKYKGGHSYVKLFQCPTTGFLLFYIITVADTYLYLR